MKQEKDARIIVLALAAPVTKFKPPQTRKRNKASSSNHAKSKRASTDGPSGIIKLKESTTFAHGKDQIMEEATDTDDNVQQNKEEPAGLNQQQPDLGLADVPQIPEEAAPGPADPNEDVNDVFEFALNNNVLDL
ncbi:hypothetical protein OsJ_26289 [Oryza sativa Japonica Group]|uniref:Uncharacterized protein n=1 Tax=Oryza sativa subsp. japonica TaxID=39947 RepID=A3BQB1_ORYSJ|nr:hypothetical protein OsJ_26289 [Oryza sativa Japonica Group]